MKENNVSVQVAQVANVQSVENGSTMNPVQNPATCTYYGVEVPIIDTPEQDVDGLDFNSMYKALRDVLKAAHTLPQTLQVLNGLMCLPIEYDGTTMLVSELLNKAGFKAGSKNLSLAALLTGWRFKDELGRCQIWRSVPGTIMCENVNEQSATKSEDKKHRNDRAYYFDEKKKAWMPVSKFQLVTIDDNKWTVEMIIRGICQSACPSKMRKMEEAANKRWEGISEVFTFQTRMDKGGMNNKAIKAKKEDVQF